MFTGIIEEIGNVISMKKYENVKLWDGTYGESWKLVIKSDIGSIDAYNGCSIAVNGTCLTAIDIQDKLLTFGVSTETLRRTNLGKLKNGDKVNIERSLTSNGRNSGHFVQGHVDNTGEIIEFKPEDDSLWVKIKVSNDLINHIVEKGYIAIDGTSLTVCQVNRCKNIFTVMLVSYTQKKITLPLKKIGELVNIEVDVMSKYVNKSFSIINNRLSFLEHKVNDNIRKNSMILYSFGLTIVAIGYIIMIRHKNYIH